MGKSERIKKTGVMTIWFGLVLAIAISYNNCSSPENTLNQTSSSAFPLNQVTWRPNRLASFSCGADMGFNGAQSDPINYAYPTFWTWYESESNPGDPYPAGLNLSADALKFITANKTTAQQIYKNILDVYPKLEVIVDASTPGPAAGWRTSSSGNDIFIDPTFHIAANTATGYSNDGASAQYALAQQQMAPNSINLNLHTTRALPYASSTINYSIGLFFHAPAEQRPDVSLTYTRSNGAAVAGEALKISFVGKIIPGLSYMSNAIAPYNADGFDPSQVATFGGFSHKWDCQRYLVTVPGDPACVIDPVQTQISATVPVGFNGQGGFSKINAMGSFGKWSGIQCFVPNANIQNNCYYNGYNPIKQVEDASNNGTVQPKWKQDLNNAPNYFDANLTPHFLSVCWRTTSH